MVVAAVVVLNWAVKDCRVVEPRTRILETNVDEAFEINHCPNSTTVLVASWPVPNVVNGKAKVRAEGHDVRQVPFKHNVPVENVVEVAFVVVPKAAVKDWRVVEPRARKSEVVVAPPLMVRPRATVPRPMVEEAVERKPPVKAMAVPVALAVPPKAVEVVNGKAKLIEAK